MKHRRIPTWLLERFALGEVPPEHASRVRDILDSDPDERARLAELERSSAEILAALPPATVAAEVARRAAATPGPDVMPGRSPARNGHAIEGLPVRRRVLALSSSLAVAAGAVLIAIAVGRQTGSPERAAEPQGGVGQEPDIEVSGEHTTAKGEPHLILHRKRGDKVDLLTPTSNLARAGDRIQISYRAGDGATHGVILSIDGAGVVNLHFPALVRASTRLVRSGQASLDHSYELDDAPGYERFVFITSDRPIDAAAVLASAETFARNPQRRARDPIPLASGLAQHWTILLKEAAP